MYDTSQTPPNSGLRTHSVSDGNHEQAVAAKPGPRSGRSIGHRPRPGDCCCVSSLVRACLLAVLCANVGCMSFHKNHYFARDLPAQLAAAPNQNPQLIDFTKLSSGVGNSDRIGPKDLLQVTVASNLNSRDVLSVPARVNTEGVCSLPMIGPVQLGGMSLEDAEVAITEASIQRGLYRAPHITVSIKKKNTIEVMVVGAVREEGKKIIPATQNDLLSIIFHAGGLSDDAGPIVQVTNVLSPEENRREAIADTTGMGVEQVGYSGARVPRSAEINLISATTAPTGNQYHVGDGGIVMVQRVDPKAIYIGGLVNKPGKYNYPVNQDLYLLDAMSLAGWTKSQVAHQVHVIRQSEEGPFVIQASLPRADHDPAHNLRLAPGDQVLVKQSAATVLLEVLRTIRVGWNLNPFL